MCLVLFLPLVCFTAVSELLGPAAAPRALNLTQLSFAAFPLAVFLFLDRALVHTAVGQLPW